MVSPKCCLTFSVILETDNDIDFGCNNNCHSNYYLFLTTKYVMCFYLVNESVITKRIPPNIGLFHWFKWYD